ncbi:hypothetical protein Ancab_007415 [Ancistrocladus abbreviatus]
MAFRVGWLLCLVFAFVVLSSARNTLMLSSKERRMTVAVGTVAPRLLRVKLDDYGDPAANPGHEPDNNEKDGGGGGRGHGDNP